MRLFPFVVFLGLSFFGSACKKGDPRPKASQPHVLGSKGGGKGPENLVGLRADKVRSKGPLVSEQKQTGGGKLDKGDAVTLVDFGTISLDESPQLERISKEIHVPLPLSSPLISVHRSCGCTDVALKLTNGRFLPLRKPFLPRQLSEQGDTVLRLRLIKPKKPQTVKGEISLIFQNGEVRRIQYRGFFRTDFSVSPPVWVFDFDVRHPKWRLTVGSGKPFQILSLVKGFPGLDAKFHAKNAKGNFWTVELSYMGKEPFPDSGEVVLGVSGDRRVHIPWKRRPEPDIRLMPEPFFFFSKVPLLGKQKKLVWIDRWKKGDRILEARLIRSSSAKVQVEVRAAPKGFKDTNFSGPGATVRARRGPPSRKKMGPQFVVAVQNMGLTRDASFEGTIRFRILRKGGLEDSLDLELLVMGNE